MRIHVKLDPPGPALLCAKPAVIHVGVLMKVMSCLTSGKITILAGYRY